MKWNLIDKLTTQLLYGVTGVILANVLDKEDFGLVGAILVFQAFASLFVDSGFSYALIQRKHPSRLDYSTVLWFNLAMACAIYVVLWFAAPLIALCFDNDQRLIPLSRVMFLSFILNAAAIVQTNRLMKLMDVRMVAASNALGLTVGAIVGIGLVLTGFGGEAFTAYGQAVRDLAPGKFVVCAVCANGYEGYLPTEKAFAQGGYESKSSLFTPTLEQEIMGTLKEMMGNI